MGEVKTLINGIILTMDAQDRWFAAGYVTIVVDWEEIVQEAKKAALALMQKGGLLR